jgi:DNA polymerase elongation subunit (family B)
LKTDDFGNKNAPFGDDDIAASITLTGQAVIKKSNELYKEYIKKEVSLTDEEILNDSIIYNDTDSLYVSMSPIIKNKNITFTDKNNILTEDTYKEVKQIENYLNTEIIKWGIKELKSKDCRFVFKREVIGDKGMFLQKKRYVMHILDDEGIQVDKFKYAGVEVVRSTMPNAIKPDVKRIIETMITTEDINKTNSILNEVFQKFKKLPVEDIAFVSSIKGYEKYEAGCNGFSTIKGMPIHVKAAYYHNLLIKEHNIESTYERISSGDKIRYFYVQEPNKYGLQSIAYKYYYPDLFKQFVNVDYEKMFEKIVFSAIERFYANVNWSIQKPGKAVKTNLLDFLSI